MLIIPSAIRALTKRHDLRVPVQPINERTVQYTMTESYKNHLDMDIVVIDINNNRTLYKKLRSNFKINKCFTVTRDYQWSDDDVTFNIPGISSDEKGKIQIDADPASIEYNDNFFTMVVNAHNQTPYGTNACGGIDISLTEATFRKYNGAVFIKELGIVVSTVENAEYIINPLSTEARVNRLEEEDPRGFIFQIFANDPSGIEYNSRYVNINGQVFKVPIHKDPTLTAGVYVTNGQPPVGVEHTAKDLLLTRYDFDEADKVLNLYRTPQDAKDHFGLLTVQKEQTLKELDYKLKEQALVNKAETEKMLVEFTREKNTIEIDYKRQINEYKRVIEELKAEADVRTARLKEKADDFEAKSMSRKDSYESASHSRKDWSEYVKWIPAVVVGVATAVAACFALFF